MSQGNIHFCILSMFGLRCSVLTVKNRFVLLSEIRFLKDVCVQNLLLLSSDDD